MTTPIHTAAQAIEEAAKALHPAWFPADYNYHEAQSAIRRLAARIEPPADAHACPVCGSMTELRPLSELKERLAASAPRIEGQRT